MSCVIYCRVSSVNQAERGYGISYQERLCRKRASYKNLEVINVYKDEGISGTKERRPALDEMMLNLEDIDCIIVYALDRLARSTRLILKIIDQASESNCSIISCKESMDTSTREGRPLITIMSAITEMERNSIREKTYAGRMERVKLDGEIGGSLPTGYKRCSNGSRTKVVVDEDYSDTVRRIFELNSRDLFPDEICQDLNSAQLRTRNNKEWYPRAIRRILKNEAKYKGGPRSKSSTHWPIILDS